MTRLDSGMVKSKFLDDRWMDKSSLIDQVNPNID